MMRRLPDREASFPQFYHGKGSKAQSKRKGQSIIEYALVIGAVVAALIAMQAYVKRGMQGRLRDAADSLGQQYEPKNTFTNGPSVMTVNSASTTIAETLSEQKLSDKYGTDINLDGDVDVNGNPNIEDDVFGTVTTNILGTWTDADNDGNVTTSEISGGSTTIQKGSETVGKL